MTQADQAAEAVLTYHVAAFPGMQNALGSGQLKRLPRVRQRILLRVAGAGYSEAKGFWSGTLRSSIVRH